MRALLEGAAARRAAPMIQPVHVRRLEEIMATAEKAAEFEELLQLNNDFHTAVYSAFKQPYLINVIQTMRNKVAPYNRIYLDVPKAKEKAWEDHYRIYEACVKGDGERAEQETRGHLQRVFEDIMNAMD